MIKALGLTIYTNYRDFTCLDEDIPNLPHDVSDGSTAITSDTGREFVYRKTEDAWKQEERPTPPFVWLGEYLSLTAISYPTYGALTSIRDETGRQLFWFNGFKWIEMVTKED